MKRGLFLFFIFCAISNAYSSDECLQRPSCEELGYDHSVEECAGRDILPCPFDIKNTETVYCGDTLCDRLVAEQGFVKFKKKMSFADFRALMKDNAKIAIAEDKVFTELTGNYGFYEKNVTINGCGGHMLTLKGLEAASGPLTLEDIKIYDNRTGNGISTTIRAGKGATLRNVEIIKDQTTGVSTGLEVGGTVFLDNVSISMESPDAEQLTAIKVLGNAAQVKDISLDIKGGDKTFVVGVRAKNKTASLSNINMTATGEKTYTVMGPVNGLNMTVSGGTEQRPQALYDGRANTKAIVETLGKDGIAAYATTQFYVGNKDGDFGQGKWYLPAIGEWMDFFETDLNKVIYGDSTDGIPSKSKLKNALIALLNKGADVGALNALTYQSSSEYANNSIWIVYAAAGMRASTTKPGNMGVRPALKLDNFVDGTDDVPAIGDVMYSDKSWTTAENYDSGKTPVGIVGAVSADKKDVTILSLKDLRFTASGQTENFNPDTPFEGASSGAYWASMNKWTIDVPGIENFSEERLVTTINPNTAVIKDSRVP